MSTIPLAKMSDVNAAHTPAPWFADGFAISAGVKTVCVMGEIDGYESGYTACDNSEANARLIAAAPDMLAALIAIEDRHDAEDRAEAEGNFTQVWLALREQALAAIAKATGQS